MRRKKNDIFAILPFLLLGITILFLITASLSEKIHPTQGESPYTSLASLIIWGATAFASLLYIHQKKLWRRQAVYLIHTAFLFILAGAMTTHLYGFSGHLHLRNGESGNQLLNDEGGFSGIQLPFTIRLDQFQVIHYPSTLTPADYQSDVTISDASGSKKATISMNAIVQKDGFRIFQQSYDPDEGGTLLMVCYDKWGVILTYIGYLMLLIGMFFTLFDPLSHFRAALRSDIWRNGLFLLILILSPLSSFAQSKTLSRSEAEAFGKILIQHQERITTVECLAIDFTKKLTGKEHYDNYSATQVLCGWLFSREEWQFEPMFRLKGAEQKKLLNVENNQAKFTDFFEADGSYKLRNRYLGMNGTDLNDPRLKPLKKLDEKVELILMLQSGKLLKIFPAATQHGTCLFSPKDYPGQGQNNIDTLLVNNFLPLLYESYSKGEDCTEWIQSFSRFQRQQLGENAPTEFVLNAERIYLRTNHLPLCSYITITIGLIGFILILSQSTSSSKRRRIAQRVSRSSLALSCLYLSYLIGLRFIVSGRMPLANGHETLLCIAWLAQIFTIFISRKIKPMLPIGLLASGFALLTASLADKDPQITPLMPVLNSPLLSIHVSLMMISYTLLFIVTLSSIIALVSNLISKDSTKMEEHRLINTVILYPAIFCLATGIFTGAVWANVSWGSYWSWDPKETWALISLLIYSFIFHSSSLPFLRRGATYHIFLALAFLFILITYFGVNYFFGGMHSYGN